MKVKDIVSKISQDKPNIIMISGKKGTGKSQLSGSIYRHMTVSNLDPKKSLSNFFDVYSKYKVDSFAKPIKWAILELEEHTGVEVEEYKESVYRKIMQVIGQQFRNHDKDIWIKSLIGRVDNTDPGDVTIIDDCRFINELKAFDDLDKFNVIKIRMATKSVYDGNDNDISETELDDLDDSEFDFIVRDWNYDE